MASIRKHVTKNNETTFKVLFRLSTGKQSSRTFGTEKAAEKFKARIEATSPDEACAWLDGPTTNNETAHGLTVGELFDKYMAAKEPDLTTKAAANYRSDWHRWLKPTFDNTEAADVTEIDVQNWVDTLRATRKTEAKTKQEVPALSAKSIADKHGLLSGMFKWGSARTRALVPSNPCLETQLPKRTKTSIKGLRLNELRWLLAAGEQHEQDAADLTAFLAGTGWRISEAIALNAGAVEVVDSASGPLVYVTMSQVHRAREGIVVDAKSDRSFGRRLRVIGPGAQVVMRRIVGKAPTEPVFTYVDGRPKHAGGGDAKRWNATSFRERRFPALVKAAGLEERGVTPHWLRHTHVAVCIALGMSLAEIQRRLGHEDIRTTINTYGRMFEELTQEMVDRADVVMRPELNDAVVVGEIVGNHPNELS